MSWGFDMKEPKVKTCQYCDTKFVTNKEQTIKFDLCPECLESYKGDYTGYCSLSCCMGDGCDGSC